MHSTQPPKQWHRVFFVLLVVLLIARTIWLLQAAWPFTTDDAYITLRYARNLADGFGLTWNANEAPVEGYSNFLYVVIGWFAIANSIDPVEVLKALGVCSLAGTCFVLYKLSRIWVSQFLSIVPALLLTEYYGTIKWTVSGLETPTYQFLVILAAWLAIHGLGYQSSISSRGKIKPTIFGVAGCVVFLCGLTRPEGSISALPILAALGIQFTIDRRQTDQRSATFFRPYVRAFALFALCFAIPYLIYFVFRWAHFGRLLPNTYYCKSDYSGDGLKLVVDYWIFARFFIGMSLIVPLQKLDSRHCILWGVPFVYFILLYNVDPIIGDHNRHFLAAHGLVLVGATIGLRNSIDLIGIRPRHLHLRDLLICAAFFFSTQVHIKKSVHKPIKKFSKHYAERMGLRQQLGDWIESNADPSDHVVIGDAGMVPYRTQAKVIDAFCLNCAATTGPEIDRSPTKFVDWMFKQEPEYIVVHSSNGKTLKARKEYNLYPTLVKDSRFTDGYSKSRVFRAKRGGFHYFVFARNNDRSPLKD